MIGGEAESSVMYHTSPPTKQNKDTLPKDAKYDFKDPFAGNPDSMIALKYKQPSQSPD